jgi:hypothetical protein
MILRACLMRQSILQSKIIETTMNKFARSWHAKPAVAIVDHVAWHSLGFPMHSSGVTSNQRLSDDGKDIFGHAS